MSKVTKGLSVRRDYSYHMNLSVENLTIALLSNRARSCADLGGVRNLLVRHVIMVLLSNTELIFLATLAYTEPTRPV